MSKKRIKRILVGFMSLLLLITSVYTGDLVVRAEDVAGKIAVNFTGNGTLDYVFYDSNDNQCNDGGAGVISNESSDKTFEIPSDAVKMVLKARAAENWQTYAASGTKNSKDFSEVDEGIFGESGKTITGFTYTDGFTIKLTFTEQQQTPEPGAQAVDVAISVNNPVGSSAAYYKIGDTGEFTKIEGSSLTLHASSELKSVAESGAKIYFKADVDNSQVLDTHNQNWYRIDDGSQEPFDLENLKNGLVYIEYD